MSRIRTLFMFLFVGGLFTSVPLQSVASIDGYHDVAHEHLSLLQSQDFEGDDPEYLLVSSLPLAPVSPESGFSRTSPVQAIPVYAPYYSRAPPARLNF
ncbi:hypothetical protein CWE12_00120 [Aliidiomarina sedimenti]|uniref:Secreted protein n=1 Tax=Aliidiomarina sedimenti TaxID=1933879 RepID=A0ABY0C0S2_9GAMM|nr:hypothetical protein [Aliidiomarina sedimenti]RUO31446.1 hypothetical protein CWE12_00120 [Aliidiomarina sedimenti]